MTELSKIFFPFMISAGGILDLDGILKADNYSYDTLEELEEKLFDSKKRRYVDICKDYGNYACVDGDLTQKAINDIREHGINYKESSEVFDQEGSHFTSTVDEPEQAYYCYAKIKSNSGKQWIFIARGDFRNIIKFSRSLSLFNIEIKEPNLTLSLDRAQERLNKWNTFVGDYSRDYAKTCFYLFCEKMDDLDG